jgi:Ca2+-binding RTX toxin-like protein
MATLAVPSAASAATSVELGSDELTVTGDAFANQITVRRVGDGYVVSDPLASLAPQTVPACRFTTSGNTHEVKCTRAGEVDVVLAGRAGDDELTVIGGTRGARLEGENGDDALVGGPGPDTLRGGGGSDALHGRAGRDTVSYADRSAGVNVTLPVDSLDVRADDGNAADGPSGKRDTIFDDVENASGGGGDDTLVGNNSANTLSGRDGTDTLSGRAGDDRLDGGLGPDAITGNDGVDLALYADRTAPVKVTLDGVVNDGDPNLDVRITGGIGGPGTADSVDAEGVIGGAAADTLIGDGRANVLDGRGGEDTVDAAGGFDEIDGGDGDDRLEGGSAGDDVSGGPGVDSVTYETRTIGGGVQLTLDGSANDGNGADVFADNIRPDVERVTGSVFDDVLIGGDGDELLDGRAGDDQLEGRDGNDTLKGAFGSDRLDGGDGLDRADYRGAEAAVVTLDGVANDGSPGAQVQVPGGERDNALTEGVIGTDFGDDITGDGGRNFLDGNGGDDTLRGGGGGDDLDGGPGVDTLLGEAGPDFLAANDGVRDLIDCGADLDVLNADLADRGPSVRGGGVAPASFGCEQQSIAPAGRLPNVALAAKVVRIDDHSRARLALRCPRRAHARCTGTVRLERLDGTGLGRARFAIRRGDGARVTLKLRRAARRGPAQVLARERDLGGRPKITLARVRVRRS